MENGILESFQYGIGVSHLQLGDLFKQRVTENGGQYAGTKILSTFTNGSNKAVATLTQVVFFDTNFAKDEHFLVTAIRCQSGANATLAATAWVPGISDALTLNGSFTLNNNGTDMLKDVPLTVFSTAAATAEENHKAGWYMLARPIMWLAQTNLKITASWTTAPTTANQNARFECWGIKLI